MMRNRFTFLFLILNFFVSISAQAQSLVWAKQMGGNSNSVGLSNTVDAAGNVYTIGSFSGTVDFDPSVGVANLTAVGSTDIFVSKLNASGSFVWAKQISAGSLGYGNSIAVDATGNIYIGGAFAGTVDFDPNAGTSNLVSAGSLDIFFAKLDTNGNLLWAKRMGGTLEDRGTNIVIHNANNIYLVGWFQGTVDFDPNAGTTNFVSAGATDIFVTKFDASGNLIWAKSVGGTGSDQAVSVTTESNNTVLITGNFAGTVDFDPDAGVTNLSAIGSSDVFILHLGGNGGFLWAQQIGGTGTEESVALVEDGSLDGYIVGNFSGTMNFPVTSGLPSLTSVGANDIFAIKFNTGSGTFLWANRIGGTSLDKVSKIVVERLTGNCYITGSFFGTADFNPGTATNNLVSAGDADIFFTKLTSAGTFVWAKSVGGQAADEATSIAIDATGNVYLTGKFQNTVDFDPNNGVTNLTTTGASATFVTKYTQNPLGISPPQSFTQSVHLSPNPAINYLSVDIKLDNAEPIQLEILSLLGQSEMKIDCQNQSNIQKNIDLTNLSNGTYLLLIKNNNGQTEMHKFVVQR